MTTVFEGRGAFLLNHFAQKPQSLKIKRMSRQPNAQEEPEPQGSLKNRLYAINDGCGPSSRHAFSGPEFDFQTTNDLTK
jgi:hypothetical protein